MASGNPEIYDDIRVVTSLFWFVNHTHKSTPGYIEFIWHAWETNCLFYFFFLPVILHFNIISLIFVNKQHIPLNWVIHLLQNSVAESIAFRGENRLLIKPGLEIFGPFLLKNIELTWQWTKILNNIEKWPNFELLTDNQLFPSGHLK